MTDAGVRLSRQEILLLRALAEGRQVALASPHRLRFELLGLVHDGTRGLRLTPLGLRCSRQVTAEDDPGPAQPPLQRDRLGRRKANRRLSPF
ncbi:MAG: hypothetical protein KIT25_03990 [Enhydrobacter sp.]|nr:MAG: hypothetical protein KIT25_03990 [Enhydrobacter sp.]